jgi:hypothetical protein
VTVYQFVVAVFLAMRPLRACHSEWKHLECQGELVSTFLQEGEARERVGATKGVPSPDCTRACERTGDIVVRTVTSHLSESCRREKHVSE